MKTINEFLVCSFLILILFSCSSKKRISEDDIKISETERVLEEFDLPNLIINYDVEIMESKPEDGMYKYIDALEFALDSYLSDGSNPESPLALIPEAMEKYVGNMSKQDQHKTKLIELINTGGLLCMPDIEGASEKCFHAEEGESAEKNWIFLLQIPELSDHLFWAIVPKDGKGKVYNYGFN